MTTKELQRLQGILRAFPTSASQDAALLQGMLLPLSLCDILSSDLISLSVMSFLQCLDMQNSRVPHKAFFRRLHSVSNQMDLFLTYFVSNIAHMFSCSSMPPLCNCTGPAPVHLKFDDQSKELPRVEA